ncbi:ImmA/IrrE family metallo-endopeptidase [Verrucomicrobiaceae bacterium 5K15]|uniref:ImmA/IrrE family metallo-endopeptidase n=1 Tax=Oceaniferula flava TaxID=2800421 RepID=A0AAE2VAV6_9BACT|nr:ImmA/IrrE family metallo-endopeptidase [Oceaniferula flavus]MBK1853800.1 ImmA/IrrE family metallo-endopeptidase [Oceaniferula flavus]MBM1135106.1 ImmA/IrrE family metallo-endopeptidase [Oceaniferula flavus]
MDRSYFSSDDHGLMGKTFSRLKRAGKNILKRPSILKDAVKKFDLRALYIPDQKRIIIDDQVPVPKQRWLEGHEIGHGILPWHEGMVLGDDDVTPTVATHDKMEAEANYAAGSLLFLNQRFVEEVKSTPPSIASVLNLKKIYGNTLTTTFWRTIEHCGEETPILGLIGQHPKDFADEKPDFKHIILSRKFREQFDPPELTGLKSKIALYCYGNRGPLGKRSLILTDVNGDPHSFKFETFYNGYDALTMAVYEGKSSHNPVVDFSKLFS